MVLEKKLMMAIDPGDQNTYKLTPFNTFWNLLISYSWQAEMKIFPTSLDFMILRGVIGSIYDDV